MLGEKRLTEKYIREVLERGYGEDFYAGTYLPTAWLAEALLALSLSLYSLQQCNQLALHLMY
jgi:hypothetical protein